MPEGAARGAKFLEIAKLATERVKKPEVCIDLWNEVVANDPENAEALNALAGLHERQKDWDALAEVLRKQVDITFEPKPKEALLGKLGALYGERLNNDGGRRGVAAAPRAEPAGSQGAGGPQEEVPHARPLGRSRGLLRRERQVGRVHPRPRVTGGQGDR